MLKIHFTQGKRYTFPTHVNDVLLPREQAECVEAFGVVIEPGKFTHDHVHEDTEQLYYVISGQGRAAFAFADGRREEFPLQAGDLVYVPRSTRHQVFCAGEEPLTYLCVDAFPRGKPAGEPTWEDHYRAVIAAQTGQR
jgi:mannose-6-phosphate isomerase-like protein (cupin superfamily)